MTPHPPFNEAVYLTLSPEAQDKVYHIYVIASMLHANHCSPLKPYEFDRLYDKSSSELESISGQVKNRLENIEGE